MYRPDELLVPSLWTGIPWQKSFEKVDVPGALESQVHSSWIQSCLCSSVSQSALFLLIETMVIKETMEFF